MAAIFLTASAMCAAGLTSHPRILLDNSALDNLRSRAAAGDAAWIALRNRCDATTGTVWPMVTTAGRYNPSVDESRYYPASGDIGYGYQGYIGGSAAQGYWEASWNLGICYQVVSSGPAADSGRKAAYAAKALQLFDVLTAPTPAVIQVNSGAKAGQTRWASDMTYQAGTAWTTSVVVNGVAAAGASTISLRGFVPGGTIVAGDGFFIGDHIYLAGANTSANGSGVAAVTIGGVRSYGSLNNRSTVGAAYADGTPVRTEIVIQSYYHNLASGTSVTISGAQGLTAANGTFTVGGFASETSAPMHFYLAGTAGAARSAYTNFVYDAGYNQGYGARFISEALGLLYDWIYPELSQSRKDAGIAAARRWVRMPEITGYAIAHPAGNYFAGVYAAKLYNALAFAGDYAEADDWYTEWYTRWYIGADPAGCPRTAVCGVQKYFHEYLTGYGHPDGANYGWLALVNTILPIEAHKTSGKGDLTQSPAPAFDWPNGAAQWYVHGTWPNRTTHLGRYKIFGSADPSYINRDVMLVLGWFLRRNSMSFAPYFQSYLNAIQPLLSASLGLGQMQGIRFLMSDPGASAADFTTLDTTYFGGRSELLMRSGWGTSDVMASFVTGPYVDSLDGQKENKDAGSLTIQRGATGFLVDSNREGGLYGSLAWDTYTSQGDSSPPDLNIFVASGSPQGYYGPGQLPNRYYQCVYTNTSGMDRHSSGSGWTYGRGYHLEQNYYPRTVVAGDTCSGRPGIDYWSREVMYLAPSVWVVYDRTTIPVAADDQYMGWHFGKTPSSAAAPAGMSRYNVSDGSTFKGAMFAVYPAGAATKVVDTHNVHAVYRVEVRPASAASANTWMHVFDASTSAAAVTPPVALTSTAVDAVQLGATVAAFARNDPPASTLAYTFTPGGSVTHHVAGLSPGESYAVTRDGVRGSVVADAAGVLTFTTTGNASEIRVETGGLQFLTASPLPAGVVGSAYSLALAVSGGTAPYTFQVTAGSLPAGLTLSAGGLLSGTPQAAGAGSFTIRVSDARGASADAPYILAVAWSPPVVVTTTLPDGVLGAPYSQPLSASGGDGSYTWSLSAGELPAGLTLLPNGVVGGSPSARGRVCPTVACSSAGQTATAQVCLTVVGDAATSLSGASLTGLAIR
jgi:hypothetical protein